MSPERERRNVAASVHQRLLNLARRRGTDFNLMLQRYAGERLLYRLGLSTEVDRFTLKGAALLLVWAGQELRPTRDLDFLGSGPADHASIRRAIEAVCGVSCPEDGLEFDPSTIRIQDIRDDQEYAGIRVRVLASLGQARIPLQVDIGFGDTVFPEREERAYPTLLDQPNPRVWAYPRDTFVAEKFEAMVRLGARNTRMKDFWDVAALATRFRFDGDVLQEAIRETFRRRGTILDTGQPIALQPAFYADAERARLWWAFCENVRADIDLPPDFDAVGETVRRFLGPIRESIVQRQPFAKVWDPGGPWRGSDMEARRERRDG